MKAADNATIFHNPVICGLNRIPNFDPLKFLRSTPNGPTLDLKYKKLWFRLKYPDGRIRMSNLCITDQLAIIEARVFFDRKDTESVASYTAICAADSAPGEYLKIAQDTAIDRALCDAGFGIQFDAVDIDKSPVINASSAQPITESTTNIQAVEAPLQQTISPVEEILTISEEIATDIPGDMSTITKEQTKPVTETITPMASPAEKIIPTASDLSSLPSALPHSPVVSASEANEAVAKAAQTEAAKPIYTKDMSVEDICAVMSLEEAENYVVPTGACAGQKLSLVAERRAASLRFYMNGYKGDDNILRAAATILTTARPELLAG